MECSNLVNQTHVLREVLNASARSYEIYGFLKSEIILFNELTSPSLVIPSIHRVENILSEYMFDALETEKYVEYRNNGLEVFVLVPLNTMGKAHETLRGCADWIQSWWFENKSVKFGRPEKP